MRVPSRLEGARAFLFDLDGVMFVGDATIPGAADAVRAIQRAGYATRFVTNTTATPRAVLAEKLRRLDLPVSDGQLFTPAALARRAMTREGGARYRLLGAPELAEDLGPGRLADDDAGPPDWVVLGLHPPSFCHQALSVALRDLLAGARLMALHRNRIWRTARGLEPGLGAYVTALEYAARVEARVIGKPSAAFFEEARADLGLPPEQVVMVGDDVESDVGGAQAAGIAGVLVRTGKFTERALAQSGVEPAWVVDDVAALAEAMVSHASNRPDRAG